MSAAIPKTGPTPPRFIPMPFRPLSRKEIAILTRALENPNLSAKLRAEYRAALDATADAR